MVSLTAICFSFVGRFASIVTFFASTLFTNESAFGSNTIQFLGKLGNLRNPQPGSIESNPLLPEPLGTKLQYNAAVTQEHAKPSDPREPSGTTRQYKTKTSGTRNLEPLKTAPARPVPIAAPKPILRKDSIAFCCRGKNHRTGRWISRKPKTAASSWNHLERCLKLYTRQLYTRRPLHKKYFTPRASHTTSLVAPETFTPDTCYTKQLL